jgi:enediyne biosynthesis protein E4
MKLPELCPLAKGDAALLRRETAGLVGQHRFGAFVKKAATDGYLRCNEESKRSVAHARHSRSRKLRLFDFIHVSVIFSTAVRLRGLTSVGAQGRSVRSILPLLTLAAALSLLFVFAQTHSAASNGSERQVLFRDIIGASGIDFVHDNAATPEKYMIETMGSGCGWIDYDADGWLDLYLVNSAATRLYKPKSTLRSALYRNNGDGTWTDVTEKSRVGAEGLFGMGIAVGDYDNDGFADLMVLGYDRSILYHNNRDGTLSDVTAHAGVANQGKWASSGAWFDYDNDGDLDLAIANYVAWSPDNNIWCGDQKPGYRGYCHPNKFAGQRPTLYRNNGDGTFSDVSESSKVGIKASSGLGIVTFDFDSDGWQDIFIANDANPNFLFQNNRDGTFREVAYPVGVAVSDNGKAEAGMGTDAADTTGSGGLDVFVTHLDFEHARLYRKLRDGSYEDATFAAKLGYATFKYSGFGTCFFDYDNDGARDIFMANGHILDNIELYHAETRYAEPKLVYRNTGKGLFENVSDLLGSDLQRPRVSRGAAPADFDNDGDLDVLVSNNGQAPELLQNEGGNRNHWLQLQLIGTRSNRDAVGARVKVVSENWAAFDQRKGGRSYQSAHDPRLHFGLGPRTKIDLIEIQWPSGLVETVKNLAADQAVTVKEESGVVATAYPRWSVKPR